ncbi:hypothetical protein BGX38DRAFT_1145605 [Terfezia claveryi]|nr:hypothetical protein BGX38DRAFT_1145605 [Terfezia claveryi]
MEEGSSHTERVVRRKRGGDFSAHGQRAGPFSHFSQTGALRPRAGTKGHEAGRHLLTCSTVTQNRQAATGAGQFNGQFKMRCSALPPVGPCFGRGVGVRNSGTHAERQGMAAWPRDRRDSVLCPLRIELRGRAMPGTVDVRILSPEQINGSSRRMEKPSRREGREMIVSEQILINMNGKRHAMRNLAGINDHHAS